MKKTKTIIRKYYSKRQGRMITKTYTYSVGKSSRGKTIIGKNGKITKQGFKNYKNWLKQYKQELIDNGASPSVVRDAMEAAKDEIRDRAIKHQKLTTTGLEGHLEHRNSGDKIRMYFTNFGTDVETEAELSGLDVNDILNENNWSNGILTIDGVAYIFEQTYRYGALRRRG